MSAASRGRSIFCLPWRALRKSTSPRFPSWRWPSMLGQRQDGNLGDVDFLSARQGKQKIERPLEAADIHSQLLAILDLEAFLAAFPIGRRLRLTRLFGHWCLFVVHACTVGSGPRLATRVAAASVTRASASASSKGSGSWKHARAWANRSADIPSSTGVAPATSVISVRLPEQ